MHNLLPRHRGSAVTIGNFDGVHRGHGAIFSQLVAVAGRLGSPSVCVTFEPQPQEFFAGTSAPSRLTPFREKMLALRATPIERVLLLRFDRALADTAPEDFIERVLVRGLGTRCVVVGDDFRFGRDGHGNFSMLQQAGLSHGFEVVRRETFKVDGGRVSSSWVRDALGNGELGLARRLLGRPYSMSGRVVGGDRLGRSIGFPTANVDIRRTTAPLLGVYAVSVRGAADKALHGVANLGVRPTVDGKRLRLEVHLFDFDREIYGARVHVEFLHKLRDEQRFASVQMLKMQIERDAALGRKYFEQGADAVDAE